MKRLLLLVVCLLFLLPIQARASYLFIDETQDTSTEKTITAEGITLTIPEGWMTVTGYTDPDIEGIFAKGQSTVSIKYTDYGQNSEKPLNNEKINKMFKTYFNDKKHNYEVVDDQQEELEFNGHPGFREKLSYKDGKGVVSIDLVLINPGNALFDLACTTNETEITFCDEFEEIINSIEFSE